MKKFAYILSVVGAFIALQSGLYAQNKKYTLTGTIYDSLSASPITKAYVLISGTKFSDSSKTDGTFKIDDLVPGTNNLIVSAKGYDTSIVRFEIRKNMKLNVKLMPRPKDTVAAAPKKDSAAKADSVKKNQPAPEKAEKKQKDKKRSVWLSGSFSIDTGYLYEFEAKFSKKPEGGFELLWLEFEMKGRNMNGPQ